MTLPTLEFAILTNDSERAVEFAKPLGGQAYVETRSGRDDLPFQALATVVSDDLEEAKHVADVGLYIVCRRIIKPGAARVFGLFGLVHHPDKTHAEADAHWRDVHAPLALEHHAHMTLYIQLSVVQTISGMPIDGFALCGFDSTTDLRERFYTAPPSRAIIISDVQTFADTNKSPRRLIAVNRLAGPQDP